MEQLIVLPGCLCCSSCRLLSTASGWDVTGTAGGPLLGPLCVEMFGSGTEDGSGLTSLGLPKQWPRDEQGSPCIVRDLSITSSDSKTSPNCTDMKQIRVFPAYGATSGCLKSALCLQTQEKETHLILEIELPSLMDDNWADAILSIEILLFCLLSHVIFATD